MASNARLDLPEPDSPVTTTSLSRGISTDMFLRLCTRAPCTAMVVRAVALAAGLPVLELIRDFSGKDERQLLHRHIALLRKLDRRRGLADEPLVGQVLARCRHPLHVEVPFKVGLYLCRRTRFSHLAQVIEHRSEQRRRPLRHITVN